MNSSINSAMNLSIRVEFVGVSWMQGAITTSLSKEGLVLAMLHTTQMAADLLGISYWTVRKWMKRCDIQGKLKEIDGKIYLTDGDIVTLASYQDRKRTASKRKKAGNRMDKHAEGKRSQAAVEKNFYSASDAALFLGVNYHTLRKWIRKHGIQKKIITTDRKRVYIAWDDVLKLADLHKRKVMSGVPSVNMAEDLEELKEKVKVLTSDVEDIKHDLRILGKRAIFIM